MEIKKPVYEILKWIFDVVKIIVIIIISLLIIGFALKNLAPGVDVGNAVAKIAVYGIILCGAYIGYKSMKKN